MGEIFRRENPPTPLAFTGERLTTSTSGSIEIEHYHRYFLAREYCRSKDVLDLACGEGYGAAFLAQAARSVVGVELDSQTVAHAAAAYGSRNLRFVCGDVRWVPLRDATVDVVVSFETIEHIYEHDEFLAEVRRVLRPGGLLIISTPDRDIYSPPDTPSNPFHVHELTQAEFAATLGRKFAYVGTLLQRPMIGSAMLAEHPAGDEPPPITFERRGADHFEASRGLPRAVYAVAFASDAPIKVPPASLYIELSDLTRREEELRGVQHQLQQERAQREQMAAELAGLQAEYQRQSADLEALRASKQGLEEQLASIEQQVASIEQQAAAMRAQGRALEAQLASERREREAVHAKEVDAAREHVALSRKLTETRASYQREAAVSQTLRLEKDTLIAQIRRFRDTHQTLQRELHQLWSSSSWQLFRPLRNIARRTHGLGREIEPVNASEIDVLRTVIGMRQSLSWELTAPLRVAHRLFSRPRGLNGAASQIPQQLPEISTLRNNTTKEPPKPSLESSLTPGTQTAHHGLRRVVYISGEPTIPGSTYRVTRAVAAAIAAGFAASAVPIEGISAQAAEIAAADVVVLWRVVWDERIAAVISAARKRGAKVVFDVDDLMINPEHARPEVIDAIRTGLVSAEEARRIFQQVQRVMLEADCCTTTTDELARHMRSFGKVTYVIPNCFDEQTWKNTRRALRRRRAEPDDGLIRIGYAAGTRTHQKDFAVAVEAIARVLRERSKCRLVLFHDAAAGKPLVAPEEFPALGRVASQIEWRNQVPMQNLPEEIVRFDISLAPLEVGNPFCESKSELKFFEAALAEVCTVASPTGPFQRAIRDGETGFLATSEESWYRALLSLVDDPVRRRQLGRAAFYDAIVEFGPRRQAEGVAGFLTQLGDARTAIRAFELSAKRRERGPRSEPRVPDSKLVFAADQLEQAEVTVIIPLHNYGHYVEEALESVKAQTIARLDLIVVDDQSTDDSLAVAVAWARRNADRFNRIQVRQNRQNSGLGPSRNTGFDAAETPYVIPLDADNRLLPPCCATLLDAVRKMGAAFAYPLLRTFGDATSVWEPAPYAAMRFAGGNYIDAMALVAKNAWIEAGGYQHMVVLGWEDYDFWCRLAERGMYGTRVDSVLAEYRVHDQSMLRTITNVGRNRSELQADVERRHPWVTLSEAE